MIRYKASLLAFGISLFGISHLGAQVFNQGIDQTAYLNLLKNGITYVKTNDPKFDSCMISALESVWTVSSFDTIARWGRPEKTKTVLFVTTMKPTREYFKDRRNQKVLVLYPGSMYELKGEPNMERTLGYIYFNGFFELTQEEQEYLFAKMMLGALDAGIQCISKHKLPDIGQTLNTSIGETITAESGTPVGNTLILHRQQSADFLDVALLEKYKIRHRLVGDDEYFNLIGSGNENYYALYFAVNAFTELSIVNVKTGKIVFTRHFYTEYPKLKAKEVKAIGGYFR